VPPKKLKYLSQHGWPLLENGPPQNLHTFPPQQKDAKKFIARQLFGKPVPVATKKRSIT
jgi:hypothetical protein